MQMFRQQRREPGAGEPAADPRLLAAVQQMPTALLLCTAQRQAVLYANASMQELLARLQPHGLDAAEPLVGAALATLSPDLARAAAEAGTGETQAGRLDFGAETVDYLISPVRDGGGVAALSVTCWLSTEQGQMAARFEREFKTVTERLVSNAGALRNGTREVTAMIETTRRDAEAVSGSANELNASIREICAHLVRASLVSQQAVDEARTSDDRIESLAQSAKAIGSIIAIINEIADHTNLLALNATIEAARAGPAGKGFAVVAQEVKTLAGQTAKATADIAAQVGAIQRASGEAVDITAAIRRTIKEVKSILAVISTAVEQQSAATREASGRLGQVSGLVSRSDAAAASLGHAAGEVDELALSLQTALDGFLDQVRRL